MWKLHPQLKLRATGNRFGCLGHNNIALTCGVYVGAWAIRLGLSGLGASWQAQSDSGIANAKAIPAGIHACPIHLVAIRVIAGGPFDGVGHPQRAGLVLGGRG